ncbi:MAG: hypothetical protein ABFD46_09945 [Armatimonadota bacterium]
MRETESNASPGWVRLVYGAASGAVVAAILGFGLSAWFHMLGLGLVVPSNGTHSTISQFVGRAGLNFYAIHHISIAGAGMPGGIPGLTLSILWPLTLWAAVPAIALALGGLVSAKLAGAKDAGRFTAGALVAIPYVIFLLIARPFFTAATSAIHLPQFEIGGWNPAPELIAAKLIPAAGGTVFYGLIFGVIFGGIGALGGLAGVKKRLFGKDAWLPAWIRGALISFLIGQLIFFCLFAVYIGIGLKGHTKAERTERVKSAVTLLPAASGLAYYISHGVTIRGGASSTVDDESGFKLSAGLIRGIETDGKKKHVPLLAYLTLIIPAVALVLGGYYAAKTSNKPVKKWPLAAGIAIAYAALMALFAPLYMLIQKSSFTIENVTNQAAITLGPSVPESFALGLVIALLFELIGISIYRPHDHS